MYSSKLKRIPVPAFYVFYNGQAQMPECVEMKLSDAFEIPVEKPSLELKVRVLNINAGMNEELKAKCPILQEYMTYVDLVRTYAEEMELQEAVTCAVDECIRNDVLAEFLQRQKMEVIKVSIYEYDEEREMRLIRADEREIGREQGIEQGRAQGISKLIALCKEVGMTQEKTAKRVAVDFAMSEVEAQNYVEKFWSNH